METKGDDKTYDGIFMNQLLLPRQLQSSFFVSTSSSKGVRGGVHACHFLPEHVGEKLGSA